MGGEVYCDGGIVASNPTAVAVHEARTLFPDIPVEMVVSIGTGGKNISSNSARARLIVVGCGMFTSNLVRSRRAGFTEVKSAPRIGWDGIIGQIVDSACDGKEFI